MKLRRFYFAHRELFLIPVEHLSERGMTPQYADVLRQDRAMSDEWIELFDRAFATYWERATELYARAPQSWFPPRLQNLAIVVEPERTQPYFQPFHKCSWLLYASDFDPETSNLEYATYQLIHAERLSTARDMAMAVICGMSYWLLRDDAEIEAFCEAAGRSERPDAAAFVRLAEVMPWVRRLYHDPLRRPSPEDTTPLRRVKEASLYLSPEVQPHIQGLVPALRGDAAGVMERYLEASSTAPATDVTVALAPSPADYVCDWLAQTRPPLLLIDADERTLWDPDAPEQLDAVRDALRGVGGRAAQSLREDLEVVGERSARFLASLRHPERLPPPGDEVEEAGGLYVHSTRPLMVYSLAQPGLDPLREAAPPYHRLLVGARTIHEWGHLSEEAGWVGLPQERQDDHRRARERIVAAIDSLLARAPEAFADTARAEAEEAGKEPGVLVCDLMLTRMSDYLSNMLSRRYLSTEELEAYVRANVHTHFDEEVRPLHLLARHAYEYQYLPLGQLDDPFRYFLRSTWFSDFFVATGLVSEPDLRELLLAGQALCDCYAVDESAFVPAPEARS